MANSAWPLRYRRHRKKAGLPSDAWGSHCSDDWPRVMIQVKNSQLPTAWLCHCWDPVARFERNQFPNGWQSWVFFFTDCFWPKVPAPPGGRASADGRMVLGHSLHIQLSWIPESTPVLE